MVRLTRQSCEAKRRERIGSDSFRGARPIAPGASGSSPNAMAGNPSVTRFIHKSWTADSETKAFPSRSVNPRSIPIKMTKSSAILEERR